MVPAPTNDTASMMHMVKPTLERNVNFSIMVPPGSFSKDRFQKNREIRIIDIKTSGFVFVKRFLKKMPGFG
jgi:hypothetical protein